MADNLSRQAGFHEITSQPSGGFFIFGVLLGTMRSITQAVLATLAYYDALDYPLKAEEVFNYLVVPVPKLNRALSQTGSGAPLLSVPVPKLNRALSPPSPTLSATPESPFAANTCKNSADNIGDYDSCSTTMLKSFPVPIVNPAPLDIRRELDQLVLERIVELAGGYYFLFEREYLVPLRRKKEKISRRKLLRARRIVHWLAWLPYVRAIFASGSLGLGNCDELSDLDVLVVTKHSRIWTTRFLITGWLSLLGLRRKPHQKIAPDKICLNHYITDQSLTIPFHSIYNAQTYIRLQPLYVRNLKIVADFYHRNPWLSDYLVNFPPPPEFYDIMIYHKIGGVTGGWFSRLVARIGETILDTGIGNWLERRTRIYQIRRIEHNPLTASANRQTHSHIVFTDEQLAFHPDSPERTVLRKYQDHLTRFSI